LNRRSVRSSEELVLVVPNVVDGVARGVDVPDEIPTEDPCRVVARDYSQLAERIRSLDARCAAIKGHAKYLEAPGLGLPHPRGAVEEVACPVVDLSAIEDPPVRRRWQLVQPLLEARSGWGNRAGQRRIDGDRNKQGSVDVVVIRIEIRREGVRCTDRHVRKTRKAGVPLPHDRWEIQRPADAGEADPRGRVVDEPEGWLGFATCLG
jgi:hypothetical protein